MQGREALESFEIKRSPMHLLFCVITTGVMILGWVQGTRDDAEWARAPLFCAFILSFVSPLFLLIVTLLIRSPSMILFHDNHVVFRHSCYPIVRRESDIEITDILSAQSDVVDERHERVVIELTESATLRLLDKKHVFRSVRPNCFAYESGLLELGSSSICNYIDSCIAREPRLDSKWASE